MSSVGLARVGIRYEVDQIFESLHIMPSSPTLDGYFSSTQHAKNSIYYSQLTYVSRSQNAKPIMKSVAK